MSGGGTPTLAALGLRLRALGLVRVASRMFDAAECTLVESPVLDIMDEVVAQHEAVTKAARDAERLLSNLGPASRPELLALRKALRLP